MKTNRIINDTNLNEFLEDEDADFTPLEELGLGVRAYCCLKRAGFESIEEIRKLNEEDYRNIRNLGRKCTAEIQQKLEEFDARPPKR